MAVKMTFTLDEKTVKAIDLMAGKVAQARRARLCARECNCGLERGERMSDEERLRKIAAIKEMMARPPEKTQAEVDRELADLRDSRRRGWSRPSDHK